MANTWTDDEITMLKQIYPAASIDKILQSLPQHSIKSIWQKASDLRIHRGVAGTNNPFYGKTHDEETRRRISKATKGRRPWNYHMPMCEEQKKKVSESRKGKGVGRIPWNKGIPTTAEAKVKIRIANIGRKRTLDELTRMRRCSLKENVFDNINEESAYWIGMLIADGNVCYKKDKKGRKGCYIISLTLQAADIEHLRRFQVFVGSSHKLYYRINYRTLVPSCSYQLSFSSEKIASALAQYGIHIRKSLVAKIELLEDNRHFWRGAIDGDGTISIDSFGRPWLKLVGSFELVSQFKAFLEKKTGMNIPQVYKTDPIYRIVISCNTCIKVLKLLYKDCNIALGRKLKKAKEIMENGYGVRSRRNSFH